MNKHFSVHVHCFIFKKTAKEKSDEKSKKEALLPKNNAFSFRKKVHLISRYEQSHNSKLHSLLVQHLDDISQLNYINKILKKLLVCIFVA